MKQTSFICDFNPIDEHYVGLPKCVNHKVKPFHHLKVVIDSKIINVRFDNKASLGEFSDLIGFDVDEGTKEIRIKSRAILQNMIGQKITNKTKSIWHPFKPHSNGIKLAYKSSNPLNPRYPVFIISKGRWEICHTARELDKMGVPFRIAVEPQEFEFYAEKWGSDRILVTPFSNLGQGSIPVRNFVWDVAINEGFEKHWVLDDNIEGFHYLNQNKKPKVLDGTIFRCIEDFSNRYENLPICGMNYYSFCKKTEPSKPVNFNTRVYSCTLIENSLQHRWRGKFNEDTDLCLRVLKSGKCTALFNAFLIGKITTMRVKGGNTGEVYGSTDNRKEFAESLKEQHPDIVSVVKKFGRWHHQVDYKQFKKNQLKFKPDFNQCDSKNNYGMELIKEQTQ